MDLFQIKSALGGGLCWSPNIQVAGMRPILSTCTNYQSGIPMEIK